MSIYYKNESDFQGPIKTPDELNEMEIRILPYWYVDDYGQIHLDIESMMSEFQTHLQGLEIICDDFNESI